MPTLTAPLAPAPIDRAVTVLVVAFAADPIIRWLLSDSDRYLTTFPALLRRFASGGPAATPVDRSPGGEGAALWVLPGAELPEQELADLLAAAVEPARQEEAFAFLGQMEEHHPRGAHHYLPFIGVDPSAQGRGVGSALLREGLARADRDGLPAYLEASSDRNRALYERHGFAVVGEVRTPSSPPLWPMLRPAC